MRGVAALVDIGVVIGSIAFVASIVRPSRYSRAAQREYAASQKKIETVPGQEPSNVFFRQFIELEQSIRTYLKQHDLYIPSRGVPRMSFSFRQMGDALYQNERISRKLRDLFLEVNKFRNLLFHGHMDKVDEGVIKALQRARSRWEEEKKDKNRVQQSAPADAP
jgi:hypothetical protein